MIHIVGHLGRLGCLADFSGLNDLFKLYLLSGYRTQGLPCVQTREHGIGVDFAVEQIHPDIDFILRHRHVR